MDIVIRYLRPMWPLALLASVCVLIETWAELAQPELMATIVDQGILDGESGIIVPTGVKMLAIIAAGAACGVLSIYAAGRVAYKFGANLRGDLYAKVTQLTFKDIDRLEPPSLITRLGDDVNRMQGMVQQSMRLLFRAPLMFVGSVGMALMIDVDISVIIVCVMVASVCMATGIMRRTMALFIRLQERRDHLTRVTQETLAGLRVVKAYANEKREKKRFDGANESMADQSVKVGKALSAMMPSVSLSLNLGTILIILCGAGKVEAGQMKVGGIMAAINYMAQIQIALMMAQHVIMGITQAKASSERIKEVLQTPAEERDGKTGERRADRPFRDGDIELRNVSFAYAQGSANRIEDATLTIKRGSTVAIIGDTGSGKTTLVNLLAQNYSPSQGGISIGGVDLRDIPRDDLRRHMGIAMQTPLLFSGTIRENIQYGRPEVTDADVMMAAEAACIADFIRSQPLGLDSRVDQGGQNLSGGQKQRLCLARMMAARPEILIIDDSLSALDSVTEKKVLEAIKSTKATKVIVSQRAMPAMQADEIVVLRSGRIAARGTHDELMRHSATYRESCEAQTR